jgi:hypothetical protein
MASTIHCCPARVAVTTESDFRSFSEVVLKPLLQFISTECLASLPTSSLDIVDFVIQLLTANKGLVNKMCAGSRASVQQKKTEVILGGGTIEDYHDSLQALAGTCKAAPPPPPYVTREMSLSFRIRPFGSHSFCQACPLSIWMTNFW